MNIMRSSAIKDGNFLDEVVYFKSKTNSFMSSYVCHIGIVPTQMVTCTVPLPSIPVKDEALTHQDNPTMLQKTQKPRRI